MKTRESPVTAVTRELAKREELQAALEATYENLDPQALLDTLEGETDLSEVLQRVASQVLEYEALANATQLRIDDLQARKARTVKAAETLRAIILQAMDTANIPKVAGPEMTLSCRRTKGAVVIDEESQIPSQFFDPQPPKLNKELVKEALTEGLLGVPGAHMSNGSLSLTIRVK